jgi:hypothetical protein
VDDLNLVKGNINLTNEMIECSKPGTETKENELIKELVQTLKGMEENLIKLITTVDHEVVMNMTLLINDDLNKTMSRYKKACAGSKPEPFVPAESTSNGSMINPTHVY